MNIESSDMKLTFDNEHSTFYCEGHWTIGHAQKIISQLKQTNSPKSLKLFISGKKIARFDSAGALALIRCIEKLEQFDNKVELVDFSQNYFDLYNLVNEKRDFIDYKPSPIKKHNVLYQIGKQTIEKITQIDGLIVLIGNLSERIFVACGNWKKFQAPSVIANINTAGLQALPILALLSFLIGVVLAYQMGLQLETYGANVFIAYLSGMASFREFAPLMTAIIVAGRTSSAFTAQIGNMKINEEIDAIKTMGLSAIELLVTPKVIGLLLIFPLLIFWSDAFSILGAMIMSKSMLGVGYYDFMSRINDSVGVKPMILGLCKAPVFSILIALVGCFQGFRVGASASSLGLHTTKSVVQSLFLIIVADALFSVIYSWLGL